MSCCCLTEVKRTTSVWKLVEGVEERMNEELSTLTYHSYELGRISFENKTKTKNGWWWWCEKKCNTVTNKLPIILLPFSSLLVSFQMNFWFLLKWKWKPNTTHNKITVYDCSRWSQENLGISSRIPSHRRLNNSVRWTREIHSRRITQQTNQITLEHALWINRKLISIN